MSKWKFMAEDISMNIVLLAMKNLEVVNKYVDENPEKLSKKALNRIHELRYADIYNLYCLVRPNVKRLIYMVNMGQVEINSGSDYFFKGIELLEQLTNEINAKYLEKN